MVGCILYSKTLIEYFTDLEDDNCAKEIYEWFLNMLCTLISVNIYLKPDSLDSNEIYRLIRISKNYTIYQKIYLYTLPECKTIEVFPDVLFLRENIQNLDQLEGDLLFSLRGNNILSLVYRQLNDYGIICNNLNNVPYGNEIYRTDILQQIKLIREKVYGDSENNISIYMIPIAYTKNGLLWKP